MRENSRRGAPRQARTAGRAGAGRDARGRNSVAGSAGRGGRAEGPAGSRPGADSVRPAQGDRAGARGADTARIASLIEPVLRAMDVDLESVKVAAAGRRRVLRIVVDADGGVSLDDIAELSREVSARLDAKDAMGDQPYTLEVSSPGVDRPLTQPRHWRRAIGRLVAVQLAERHPDAHREAPAGPVDVQARVIDADEEHVTLQIDGAPRTVRYGDLGPGRVQVEFDRLPEAGELDDFDESWDGPGEEGPDGH